MNKFSKILITFPIALLVLLFVPIIWSSDLSADFDKLTEEWYKKWFSLLQLYLGFVLFKFSYDIYTKEKNSTELKKMHEIVLLKFQIIDEGFKDGRPNFKDNKLMSEISSTMSIILFCRENYSSELIVNIEKYKLFFDFNIEVKDSFEIILKKSRNQVVQEADLVKSIRRIRILVDTRY